MATEISSVIKKKPCGFMSVLSSAVCEWFLIFLLFVEACFSCLLIKFAHYCELKPPCLLCSRIDKGFEKKKPGYYWSLLCCNHREEISSLISCSVHSKFADVNGMCEECLFPIAMQNNSNNSDSYRVLVGKHLVDVDKSVLQNLLLNKNIRVDSQDRRTCSCCNKIWRARSNADRLLLELNPIGFGASKANVKPPLPRVTGRSRFSRRDSLKRLRDKFTIGGDNLAHVGYSKLKFFSDSESEVPSFSEDDDDDEGSVNVVTRCINCSKPAKYENDEVEKGVDDEEPNLVDLTDRSKNVNSLPSDDLIETALLDLDWEECINRTSSTSELISFDDCRTPDAAHSFFGALAESSKANGSIPHMGAISVLSELLSLCNVPNSPLSVRIPKKKSNDAESSGKEDAPARKHLEVVAKNSLDNDATSPAKHTEAVPETSTDDANSSPMHNEVVPETSSDNASSPAKHKETEAVPESSSAKHNEAEAEAVPETSSENATSSAEHTEVVPEASSDDASSSAKHKEAEAVPETSSDNASSPAKDKEADAVSETSSDNVISPAKHKKVVPEAPSDDVSSPAKHNEAVREISSSNPSEVVPETSSDNVHSSLKHTEAVTKASSDNEPNTDKNQNETLPKIDETKELTDSIKNEEEIKSPPLIFRTITDEGSSNSPRLQMSASMKKNKFSYESLDEITVAEIEGESQVDRLNRQVEHDRNLIKSLYKDLEEEQNAAAIAANQAMAMITRLQEEKAALHMEALQYLRMMEEQAEYDMEALERANELLAEKEKELQDMETELEFYRMNLGDENSETPRFESSLKGRSPRVSSIKNFGDENSETPKFEASSKAKSPRVSSIKNFSDENSETPKFEASLKAKSPRISSINIPKAPRTPKSNGSAKPNFEDEKLYISQCLKKLEKKLDQAYVDGKLDHETVKGVNSDNIKFENIGDVETFPNGLNGVSDHEKIENMSGNEGEKDLKKEISQLHERLEALETDRSFLKHISELLRNGKDGYQLVQDISHQLQELRKINSKTSFEVAYLSIEK